MSKISASKKKSSTKRNKKQAFRRDVEEDPIVVDKDKKLIFDSEDELFERFESEIQNLEEEFYREYDKDHDIPESEFDSFEDALIETLAEPDEIWDAKDKKYPIQHFIKTFEVENGDKLYYVAISYVADENPTFVLLHFPTKDADLLHFYQRGEKIFDINDMEETDALSEGDELAEGLYEAMLKIRSDKDIPEDDFRKYTRYRNETIEEPDEIWRDPDLQGNVLVSFVKDFTEGSEDLFYVAVAVEDKNSDSHLLLFSFPTTDRSLVERYQHGENLHAEEVVQNESH